MAREQVQQSCDAPVNDAPGQESGSVRRQDGAPSNTVVRNPAPDAAPASVPSEISGIYRISR
jgi:hypothetical protein